MADIPKPTINVDGNKIYDDAIAPVTHPTAQTLGLIPRAIKAALFPIEKWIIQKEHALKETERLLEKKLQNTVLDNIILKKSLLRKLILQYLPCKPFRIQWITKRSETCMHLYYPKP